MNKRKLIVAILAASSIGFALTIGISYLLAAMISQPSKYEEITEADVNLCNEVASESPAALCENVTLKSADGINFGGWHIPYEDSTSTIIAVHGGSGTRKSFLPLLTTLRSGGFNVFLIEYRNHGSSDRDTKGITLGITESADVEATIRWLKATKNSHHIGLIGASLGSSSSLLAAYNTGEVDAVILQSTGFDVAELLKNVFPALPTFVAANAARFFLWRSGLTFTDAWNRQYPQLKAADSINSAVMFMHGSADPIVKIENARLLYQRIKGKKYFISLEGLGHDITIEDAPFQYKQEINQFFYQHLPTSI
jgi:dipeptidyl aminopeptidase/acylaminoacyl peptidase